MEPKKNQKSFLKGVLLGALIMIMIYIIGMGARALLMQMRIFFPGVLPVRNEIAVEDKLDMLHDIINEYFLYADDIDEEALRDGILSGFVSGLGDPYSTFFNREATARFMESLEGEFSGIGASMSAVPGGGAIEVINVFDDTPAQEAGLQQGDIIFQVDEQVIYDQDLTEIVNWIRGPEGTDVVIHLYRDGERLELEITRRRVQIPTIAYELSEDGIGYIRVSEFDRVTTNQFIEALDSLEEQGMSGLIVDLRNNPGGDVNVVVNMLQQILPAGPIVSIVDRHGNRNVHSGSGQNELTVPLVVLVNQFSASASEIFAGAVQDYEIGTVMGVTTFGKGVVQQLRPLPDGTMLRITVAEYLTPNDRNINLIGITPDVEVVFDHEAEEGVDNQRQAAEEYLLNSR